MNSQRLRAKVKYHPRDKRWIWWVADDKGQLLGKGEERHLKDAYETGRDLVAAVRTWIGCGRGALWNSGTRLDMTFVTDRQMKRLVRGKWVEL